jgi:hypothetical protein
MLLLLRQDNFNSLAMFRSSLIHASGITASAVSLLVWHEVQQMRILLTSDAYHWFELRAEILRSGSSFASDLNRILC